MPDETNAVRDVLRQVYEAWSNGDADAFAALYTEDATVVLPRVFNHGRSAVRDHMAAGFAGPLKGSRGVDDPQDIRIIGTDTAIVVSRGGILMPDEETLPPEREVTATWVLTKQTGTWRIAAYANAPSR